MASWIGVDLGGTNIAAARVDAQGRILQKKSVPTRPERSVQAVVDDIAALCRELYTGVQEDEVRSIGVGLPGIAAPDGTVLRCVNLGWRDVPLAQMLTQAAGLPVVTQNDATAAGWAEARAGVSRGVENSLFITIGTGIGGAVIIGGRICSGAHGVGSEIGHMVTHAHGRKCACGNRGCWEQYASASALASMGRDAAKREPQSCLAGLPSGQIDARAVIDAARAGDGAAERIYARYIGELALGIVSLANILDPEMVVLGGGVSGAGEFLLEPVREAVAAQMPFGAGPRIELARLGNDAGLIGAALLEV